MADSKWTATVVRKQFLDYFEKKGHTIGMWRGTFEEGEILSGIIMDCVELNWRWQKTCYHSLLFFKISS